MKIVLEKTRFQRGFEIFRKVSFIKKSVEEASKTENIFKNLARELHDTREVLVETLVLALHCYSADKK